MDIQCSVQFWREGIRRIIACRRSPRGGVQPRHQTLILAGPHPITVPQESNCTCPTYWKLLSPPPSPSRLHKQHQHTDWDAAKTHRVEVSYTVPTYEWNVILWTPDFVQLPRGPTGKQPVQQPWPLRLVRHEKTCSTWLVTQLCFLSN